MGNYLPTAQGPSTKRAAYFHSFEVSYSSHFKPASDRARVSAGKLSGNALKTPLGRFEIII